MRVFDMTQWDVKITLQAESIKSAFLEGLLELFNDTGYNITQTEEYDNGNRLVWNLKQE